MSGIPVVDLFAGAGGLSTGVAAAGGDVRVMVDTDPSSCETVRANAIHRDAILLEQDVTSLTGTGLRELAGLNAGDPCVVVGGPPCQPFSKAAYWTDAGDEARYRRARARGEDATRPVQSPEARPDPRRSLVGEFWRVVHEVQADAFLMENVPSILHPRNRGEVESLLRSAEADGYKVRVVKANSADYGVPQGRTRVFVLGSRASLPDAPTATHRWGDSEERDLPPAATAGDRLAPYAGAQFFEPEEVVTGRWSHHLRTIPPGWNYKYHTAWAGHPTPTFVTETRFWNFLLKLSPDRPSWTIAANPGPWTGPFHWDDRRLRIPELAALQGFPDGYEFRGTRRERVRQIGNAVPPPFAAVMMAQLLKTLRPEIA